MNANSNNLFGMDMPEKLVVRDFAGLETVELNLQKINILIGPQASGKSVLAKLLFFFRGIWQQLYFFPPDQIGTLEGRKEEIKSLFKNYFPPDTWGNTMFSFQYNLGGISVALRRAPSRGTPSEGLILTLPDFVEELFQQTKELSDLEKRNPQPTNELIVARQRFLQNALAQLRQHLGSAYYDSQLFIPAGRAFFSNIESNVFSFIARSKSPEKLDPFLAMFGEYYGFVKRRRSRNPSDSSLEEFRNLILRGKFVIEKDKEYVLADDERKLPLGNLSSGQQELLPLLLVLEVFGAGHRPSGSPSRSIYIEEPEAHLFPDFQRLAVEHIVKLSVKDKPQSLFVTTHSPYVLTALNNLMFAGQIAANGTEEIKAKVSNVVPKDLWLVPGEVSAYAISEGSSANIIDGETHLIDSNYIDDVSTQIGQVFDKLLAIDNEKMTGS